MGKDMLDKEVSHQHVLEDDTIIEHTHEHGHRQENAHIHEHKQEYAHIHEHINEQEHTHTHGHTHQNTKAVLNRLSKIIGHLESVKRMVESGRDCSEVLIQLAAVKSAVNSTGKVILKDHLEHCIIDALEQQNMTAIKELNDAIDKFIK